MEFEFPKSEDLAFKGWVPNLDGSISFSSFGTRMSAAGIITSNIGGFNHRYVISLQRRNLRDALFPPSMLLRRFLNRPGDFYLVCIAETVGESGSLDNKLTGILCLVQPEDISEGIIELVRDAQQALDACGRAFPDLDSDDYVRENFANSYDTVKDQLRQKADFTCEFSLLKTGITTIVAPTAWRFHDRCTDAAKRREQRYIVCSQLFYFLKDLGHRHQHHSPRTDTICDLYPATNDKKWKYATFRRIYLKMCEYEWPKSEEVYFSSLGMLSYLRSFYRIVKKDITEYELVTRVIVPLRNMELSINASQQTMNRRIQGKITASEKFRTIMIGVLGLVLSFVSLSQMIKYGVIPIGDVSPFIIVLDKFILGRPLYFVAVVAAGTTIGWVRVHWNELKESRLAFATLRALQGFQQNIAALILALVAILIPVLMYYFHAVISYLLR